MGRLVKGIEGVKFGKLTVIEFVGVVKRIGIWKCLCECGNYKNIRYRDLHSGNSKTCGCGKTGLNSESTNWRGYQGLPKTVVCIMNKNAKCRGIVVDVTIKFLWELYLKQDGKCAISGLNIFFADTSKGRSDTTASIDRIDSTKGYTESNVQWVHKHINKMKMNFDQDIFINYCKIIAENTK